MSLLPYTDLQMAVASASSEESPSPSSDDYGPRLGATTWSLTAIAAFFLGLRIFSKLWRNRLLWWDDYVLIASWVGLAVSCSLLSACISLGYGRHNSDIPPENFENVLLLSYAAGFASILAATWSKISFAITLLRISKGWVLVFLWFIIVSVNLVLGANATIHWIQCWPVDKLWRTERAGTCWPRSLVIEYGIFAAAYSGVADIALALLPWIIVWPSAISKKEKLGALVAMSMGIFAGITSFLKITTVTAIDSSDTIESVELLIFGTAESASTIMAVSIPMLRALFRAPKPRSRKLQHPEDANLSSPTASLEVSGEKGSRPSPLPSQGRRVITRTMQLPV